MVAYTTTYSFAKPTVGDDEDVWGGYLNGNFDTLESLLKGTTALTAINVTGNITVGGTVDGVDIAARDAVLTSTTATANAALPKAGGTMTGAITFAAGQTFDGRDVSADGAKLDGIEAGATADQTKADIDALGINAATLDSLDSTQFLRSDASDTTSGVLTATDGMISEYLDLGTQGNRTIQALATRATIGSSGGYGDLYLQYFGGNLHTVNGGGTLYANGNTVWHAGNDGSGSGLDADTVDGIQASSFLRSDANDTASGIITLSSTARDALNFSGNATDDHRGVAFNGRAALTADYNDGYLRLNNASEFSNGVFTPGAMRADGGFNVNGATVWNSSNDGSGSGLDADLWDGNQFSSYLNQAVLTTSSPSFAGLNINGNLNAVDNMYVASNIYHEGDTNTSIQFGSDSIRLYTGGVSALLVTDNGMFATSTNLRFFNSSVYEGFQDLGTGSSFTCDANDGGFSATMNGNTTFTFTTPAFGSGYTRSFILELTGNGSTVTWPASVEWAGGTAPDAPASGETDVYVFYSRDGGTTWYGVQSIDAAA